MFKSVTRSKSAGAGAGAGAEAEADSDAEAQTLRPRSTGRWMVGRVKLEPVTNRTTEAVAGVDGS
jgi:hypothetical protein